MATNYSTATEKPDLNDLNAKIQSVCDGLAGVAAILNMLAQHGNDAQATNALDLLCEQTYRFSGELGDIAGDVSTLIMAAESEVHHA